ncbi:hypothetical protein EYR41_006824 [Orbilia oligospora]|uniref:Uncharacterized protein n=1 Tax=Orbilia oligospora TaxID=2813651 RepID=A0A8H2HQ90_ORBOL|nr:hypothetical protein TWF132_005208 [Orbilia oligospora]TGJ67711.1 hypothetical protein EYR41_006824 [Orbilia oligospora]
MPKCPPPPPPLPPISYIELPPSPPPSPQTPPSYPHTHTIHYSLCTHTLPNQILLPKPPTTVNTNTNNHHHHHRRKTTLLCICPNIPNILPKISINPQTGIASITGAELTVEVNNTSVCNDCLKKLEKDGRKKLRKRKRKGGWERL